MSGEGVLPANPATFAIGDVVRWFSSTVPMTVIRIQGNYIRAAWFDDAGELLEDIFHAVELRAVSPDAGDTENGDTIPQPQEQDPNVND